jgi:tRNA threonylcarbamoyladenosine biosynthesis protein TsaB
VTLEVALETSARPPSVALRSASGTLERELDGDRAHASDLLPALDDLLRRTGAAPGDVSAVYVGIGPGSYTGLRAGLALAKGLVLGTGAKLVGVSSLESTAWSALAGDGRGAFALDARQGEVYLARYGRRAGELEVLLEPCARPLGGLASELVAGEPLWCDAGVRALALPPGLDVRVAPAPRAAVLLELGARALRRRGADDPRTLEPAYLRPFAIRPARA